MNVSTSAIVLHLQRVSDRASILHLYTRDYGRIPYYVYGSTGGKRGSSCSLRSLAPLTLLSIEAVHQDNRDVQQLREFSPYYIASATVSDICRSTEAIFLAEVFYRTLTHPMPDPALFDFLELAIMALDKRSDPENVHLEALVGLIDMLGFSIDYSDPSNEDLLPLAEMSLSAEPSTVVFPRFHRQKILRSLMRYYAFHLGDFQEPKSLDVMMQVFD